MAELGIGLHGLLALANAVVSRHDGGGLGRQADAFAEGCLLRVVSGIGIEGGEGRDGRAQDIHRVGCLDDVDDLQQLARQRAIGAQLGVEIRQFLGGRELAI